MRSAPVGTGIIAGGPMRAVFEALGLQDVVSKSIGANNPINMVRATFNAFKSVFSPRDIAIKRGLKISDLVVRRKEKKKETRINDK
jgi:small subunit ribosomal protein S5